MSKNKLIILGCGPSGGVPTLTRYWGQCDPQNPKNFRTRASAYVEADGVKLLIDTSPDLRQQFLKNNLSQIDAVLYTHAHADHTHGIDELRALFFQRKDEKIPIYGTQETLKSLVDRFSYLFQHKASSIYPQVVEPYPIEGAFSVKGLEIRSFAQNHGAEEISTGFRIGNMAYSTDFKDLDEAALSCLKNLDLWVVDCLSLDPRPTHLHLEKALEWIRHVKPRRAILTHMNGTLDYEKTLKILPPSVVPAYDGMTVFF